MDPTTISTTATPTTATPASQLQLLEIPQFVVIHDQVNNTYKHPVVHYAFEDEEFPIVPKDKLILVDLDSTATHLKSVNSYSPHFQVTECIVEQGQMSDQFDHDVPLVNLTIEGTAAPRIHDIIEEGNQPIRNMDHLKEVLFNFRNRNEILKEILQQPAEALIPRSE